MDLHAATEDARDVLAVLRDALAYGADQEIEDDFRRDALEGETDVFDMIDVAIEDVALCEAHVEAISTMIANLQARKKRVSERAKTIRTALGVTMEVIEEKKLIRPIATISLPKAKIGLEIDPDHEHELPDQYLEVITPEPTIKIKTDEIIAALRADEEIAGCALVELPRSVSIRVK